MTELEKPKRSFIRVRVDIVNANDANASHTSEYDLLTGDHIPIVAAAAGAETAARAAVLWQLDMQRKPCPTCDGMRYVRSGDGEKFICSVCDGTGRA